MKKLLLAFGSIALLGLSVSHAWCEDALEEQARHDPYLAEAIKNAKAHGEYGHPSLQVPQRDLDRAAAYNMERDALNLRRMGMTPETTRKGLWAALHKPNSACAQYIRQLTGDADAPQDGPVASFAESDQMLIMKIEHYGTCERRNLN